MKNLHPLLLLVVITFTLDGCAYIHSLDRDLDTKVQQWMREQEYSKALDALSHVRQNHKQYELLQKRKIEVQRAADRFEKVKLREVNAHIEAEDWQAAESTLNYSMAKLPDSKKLQVAYDDFIKQRAHYLKGLYYQLSINKAEWLVKNKSVKKELARSLPDNRQAQKVKQQQQKEITEVHKQLTICGIETLNIGDLELAEQCYMLANELKPDKNTEKIILDIQRKLAKQQKRKPLLVSKRGQKQLEKAKSSLSQGELKVALAAYKKIPSKDKKHALVVAFRQELNSRIKTSVKQGIKLGRKLYSQGQIEQAVAVWNDVLELDPNNEYLKSHVERAQRVIENLDKLKKQESTVSPPRSDTNAK